MLVIVPTYKKMNCIDLSILSILHSRKPQDKYPCRIAVINNYPPHKEQVEEIVAQVKKDYSLQGWSIDIIYRTETIPAADNWYSAVLESSYPDEVVLFAGDNDIYLPNGIIDRYNAILESDSDMLISMSSNSLYYFESGEYVYFPKSELNGLYKEKEQKTEWVPVDYQDVYKYGTSFIGSLCYRNTDKLKEAIKLAFSWAVDQEDIIASHIRIMIPSYLPLAMLFVNGKVTAINKTCVLRGTDIDEFLKKPCGGSLWDTAILIACLYKVLNNSDLKCLPLDALREQVAECFNDSRWISYFNNGYSNSEVRTVYNNVNLPKMRFKNILPNIRKILGQILKLRGWRLARQVKNTVPCKDFLFGLPDAARINND